MSRISAFALACTVGISALTGACAAKKSAPSPTPGVTPSVAAGHPAAQAVVPKGIESVWSVRDNGKRCIVAPCPSWTLTDVDSRASVDVATVDLSALRFAPDAEAGARAKLMSGIVRAHGTVITVPKMGPGGDGLVLKVTALVDAQGGGAWSGPGR